MSETAFREMSYPFAEPPRPAQTIEVVPGILWLRFPLPFVLDHINLWLLEEADGWTLVDCGIYSDLSRDLWESLFAGCLKGKPILRLIVTHFHPDHLGCAGWLVERWQPQFLMSRGEWLYGTMLHKATGEDVVGFWSDFYRSAGLDAETRQAVAARGETYALRVAPIPRRFDRLQEGDHLSIGGRDWQVIIGVGHAPEMICLYCAGDKLLISADQVLPGISPNVSVFAPEPLGDPLSEFLGSLRRFAGLDPDTLVLPSHGRVFHGLQARLARLQQHHDERLAQVIEACRSPTTIAELLPVLFRRTLDLQQTQFAVGEALAHANHLVARGNLRRLDQPGQPLRFQAA